MNKPAVDLSSGIVRPLVRLAVPFAVQNVLGLVGLIANRLFVGRVGTEALAALGSANAAAMVLVTFSMGMAIGSLAGVARHIGARQPREAARYLSHGLYVGLAFGALMLLCAFFAPDAILRFMGAEAAVSGPASRYLAIAMGGMLLQAPLVVAIFSLQGAGEARAALAVGVTPALVNIALDPLFIFVFGLGMPGAAWATVCAHAVGLFVAAWVLLRSRTSLRLDRAAWRLDPEVIRRVVLVGVPGSTEQVVRTVAGFAVVTLLQPFGAVVIAAYTAATLMLMVLLTPGLALGQATATLVGQALGAGQPHLAWRTAWISTGVYALFMVVAGLAFLPLAPYLIAAFDHSPPVVAEGAHYLRILLICGPLIATAMTLSKAFGGAGNTMPAMVAAILAHLLVQIPLVWLLSRHYGTTGAYVGIVTAFIVHGLLAAALFVRHARRWVAPAG